MREEKSRGKTKARLMTRLFYVNNVDCIDLLTYICSIYEN